MFTKSILLASICGAAIATPLATETASSSLKVRQDEAEVYKAPDGLKNIDVYSSDMSELYKVYIDAVGPMLTAPSGQLGRLGSS